MHKPFLLILIVIACMAGACEPSGNTDANGNGNGNDNTDTGTMRVEIPVGVMVGTVPLTAGEESSYSGVYVLPSGMADISNATVDLQATLEGIQVVPDAVVGGKQGPILQSATTQVTYRIGPMEDLDTVCETGVTYGPFLVTSDDGAQPMTIEPAESEVDGPTLEVVNSGAFAVCVIGMANVSGSLTAGNLVADIEMSDSTSADCDDGGAYADFAGNWRSTYECTDSCGAPSSGEFDTTIIQDGRNAEYFDGEYTFAGTVCGDVFTFSIEQGAGFSETGTLTLNEDDTATRMSTFQYEEVVTCSGECVDAFVRTP